MGSKKNKDKNMHKDFDKWNGEKKRADAVEIDSDFYFHEREIWWCAIGANIGVETDGKHDSFERPVLIVRKFNKEMFWGVPLTSGERSGSFYTPVQHESGCSVAMLSQVRTWSSKRLLRKISMLEEKEFELIRGKIAILLSPDNNRTPL